MCDEGPSEALPSFDPAEAGSVATRAAGSAVMQAFAPHAMGAIVNGMALHGGIVKPYGSTFLIFSDYMRPRDPALRAHWRSLRSRGRLGSRED